MTEAKPQNHPQKICLLVEDQKSTSEFLRQTVQAEFPELYIVEYATLREAQEWLKNYSSGRGESCIALALIDLGLPDGSGIEIIRQICRKEPGANIVVVTMYNDDAFLFESLAAGATGYLLKQESPQFLAEVLRRIHINEPPLSPSIARRLLAHFKADLAPAVQTESELTARETETLTLLARGLTVGEAAKQLGLSAQTVAGYVKIIYQKLHVSNRAEATREAIRRGLA